MFERPRFGERAVLVHLVLGGSTDDRDVVEFQELSAAAGADCTALITGSRQSPDSRLFVGKGKADEIHQAVLDHQAEVVIFDHALSPSQERNLEALLKCRVVDRTGLILDIFAQRARSFEGKLQVELAQLRHMATRLVRGWTHLERQKGGIGLRGPGETQLETDRRLLSARIKQIERRLTRVAGQRYQGRRSRQKAGAPTVSLVGYTNAGKTTLFNRLTDAGAYAADQLFATLDPTLRRLPLGNGEQVVLADTVGFISQLPHELVAAFHSTLQETREATLLLHVIDAASDEPGLYRQEVERVLAEIGADGVPVLLVFNKLDLLDETPRIDYDSDDVARAVWVSAQTGDGIDLLLKAIAGRVQDDWVHGQVRLPPEEGRLRARLFSLGAVIDEQLDDNGTWLLEVCTSRTNLKRLYRREGLKEEWVQWVA